MGFYPSEAVSASYKFVQRFGLYVQKSDSLSHLDMSGMGFGLS